MRQSVPLLFAVLIGLFALFVSAQELDPFLSDDEFSKADLKNIDSHTEYPNGVNVIPGEAELDYPTFHLIPKTSFTCEGKIPGFYTDVEARCQAWHTCDVDARMQTFLCPNGTIYSQEKRVCEWWYNVNCDAREVNRYLDQNRLLYISPRDNASQLANVDIPRKVIPNNNNAPKSQQQYSQQQQRPQQQYSQQQPQQQQRGQQQRPEPSYSQQLQQNYTPNPTQDYYQQQNQQNYSPTPQVQRQSPAPQQQRSQQQNYSPAPQQRPQQNYTPAPPQQQQQQRTQQTQNYSPAPPQRSQQNYSPAPVQQQRSQQKSTTPAPQQQRPQQQPNYSPAPVQTRPQQQNYSPAPPQQRPSQQQQNYSPPPPQQQQNYAPASQQQRPQQQNFSPAPAQNNRPQQNFSPAPPQNNRPQQNQSPAPAQQRPQQQNYTPAPQQSRTQQQQNYSPAPQQQNYNPSQSQRTNSNGQQSSRQQPQVRPTQQIASPLTAAVEAATGAIPLGPNRFQSQQPRQQSQAKQQQRYQPDQDYNRYDGQQSNNDYRPTDYDRSQQSRNPPPQQQRNSSPPPQQQRSNQAPRPQQQPQQQRRPQSAPSTQDQRQQSYDGQSYNQEQNRAPSQGSRSNNIAPEPRPKTTPAPPPPPPQPKFRHSTPRKHNVKFASTSRQQYYDDGKESQIPSESQQQGFPYSQVYNRNYEKISQYQAVQQQQQYTSEPTTLAPQVLNRYEVSPPPQLTPEVPTARRVPQNYRPEPTPVPQDFNNAPFGLEGTSTYEQLQASKQSTGVEQVPQQRRGRLNPSTATRIVVKPRLENKNQAFEIRAARREDANPEIVYPAPLEVSEDEEYAIKSQFAAAEVNYGRRQ